MAGWTPDIGEHPYPPANAMVIHSFMTGCLDLRWDDPSLLNTGPAAPTQATANVQVTGTPVVNVDATGTVTVGGTPIAVGLTLTVGTQALTAVAGARTPGNNDFNGTLGSTTLLAAEIADAISDINNDFRALVTATATLGVISFTSAVAGAAGNSIALVSTSPLMVASAATLTGGVSADTLTIGGIALTAVQGARTAGGGDFSINGSSFDIADDIVAAIADVNNNLTGVATATSDTSRVLLTAVPIGYAGNDVALSTTSAALTVSGASFTGGIGIQCAGESNTRWTIVGVNVYRSDTGERGPYFRVNKIPVGTTFFRDCTSNVLVEEELVDWDMGWASRGDAANDRRWTIRTRRTPIVKMEGQAVAADSPHDVTVYVDGVEVPVDSVFGPTGEITLINRPTYDPSIERNVDAVLPASDGSSVVTVTYHRQGNLVKTDLDMKAKIHYRLTTVVVDPNGTTPSGLIETPLGYTPAVSPVQREELDYMWREAIRRNRWILEQGGERVKLFIRRRTGIPCPCQWDPQLFEFAQQPLNHCADCYGTGFVGGFEGPIDVILAPDDSERRVAQTPIGRHMEHQYEVWTGPTPLLSQRDFVVKQNGERYSIGPVRRTQVRGVVLQQSFNIGFLEECDIRYQVPMTGLTALTWPQTRYTRPQDVPCEDSDPFPVGYTDQATPMGTEVGKIPDGREQRGRTPVWQNVTYGGKGS